MTSEQKRHKRNRPRISKDWSLLFHKIMNSYLDAKERAIYAPVSALNLDDSHKPPPDPITTVDYIVDVERTIRIALKDRTDLQDAFDIIEAELVTDTKSDALTPGVRVDVIQRVGRYLYARQLKATRYFVHTRH